MEENPARQIPLVLAIISIAAVLGMAAFALLLLATSGGDTTAVIPPPPLPTIASVATVAVQSTALLNETAVAIPTPSPAAAENISHTVQAGETLFAIALQYEMEPANLIALNQLANPDALDVGQVLRVSGVTAVDLGGETAVLTNSNQPSQINGIPINQLVNMDAAALQTVRTIFARGQIKGRNPNAFAKAGDSTIEIPHFLSRFDSSPYNLADFAYLQPTIAYYQGSFARDSAAVRIGMHSWTMLDPVWADKSVCQPNETPIACEIRIQNPSIMLVRLGANDNAGEAYFDEQMRLLVDAIIAEGVVPILGTKADRAEGSDINNRIIRQITADYHLPVWDFDLLAGTLPARGLDVDSVHMTTFYAHDYTDPTAFTRGHAMHNLTALILLDSIRREVADG